MVASVKGAAKHEMNSMIGMVVNAPAAAKRMPLSIVL